MREMSIVQVEPNTAAKLGLAEYGNRGPQSKALQFAPESRFSVMPTDNDE